MELIKFEDTVDITRDSGEVDEYDNLVTTDVWSGKGRYQQGGQVYSGFLVRNSVLFLPEDVAVEENDRAVIVLANGRTLGGIAGTITNVRMPLTYELCTRIELKQVTDIREDEQVSR